MLRSSCPPFASLSPRSAVPSVGLLSFPVRSSDLTIRRFLCLASLPRPAPPPLPRLPPAFSRGPLPCRRRRTRLPVSLADAALALRVSLDGLAGPPSRTRCPRLPFSFAGAAATPSPPHPAHRERAPSPAPVPSVSRRGPSEARSARPPSLASAPAAGHGLRLARRPRRAAVHPARIHPSGALWAVSLDDPVHSARRRRQGEWQTTTSWRIQQRTPL